MSELIITLALGIVILVGASQLFFRVKDTTLILDNNYRANANERVIFDFIHSTISQAGNLGCAGTEPAGSWQMAQPRKAGHLQDFSRFNQSGLYGADGTTDEIFTYHVSQGKPVLLTEDMESSNYLTVGSGHTLNAGDWIIITDCLGSAVASITEVIGEQVVLDNCGACDIHFESGARVYRLDGQRFYLDQDSSGKHALYAERIYASGKRILLNGLVNFQVQYGYDLTGDEVANRYLSALEITDLCHSEPAGNCWKGVTSVRLELVTENNTVAGIRQLSNTEVATQTNPDQRRIIRTIALRNR